MSQSFIKKGYYWSGFTEDINFSAFCSKLKELKVKVAVFATSAN